MPLSKYQRYLVAIVPIIVVGLIAYYFLDIVTYIILAWILSMIGAPLFNKLRGFIGESGSAVVTLLSFSLITAAIIYLFIPPIVQQARTFASIDYESVGHALEEPLNDWNDWLIEKGILEDLSTTPTIVPEDTIAALEKPIIEIIKVDSILANTDSTRENITIVLQVNNQNEIPEPTLSQPVQITDTFLERAKKNLFSFLNPARVSQILSSIFGALGNTFVGIMSVFFIAFFFLKEQKLFASIFKTLSPDDQEEKWSHAIEDSARLLKRYFIGIVIQMVIITIFVSMALGLLGFKNALLIGFFAAFMNVIPYLGPILGAAFGVIITLTSNLEAQGPTSDLGEQILSGGFYDVLLPKLGLLVLVFGAMQLFDNFIVQPNIFSKSVKAHPLEIFIIILVGAKLGGVLGMVIAIPLYTILRVLAKVFLSEFKIVQRITQGME